MMSSQPKTPFTIRVPAALSRLQSKGTPTNDSIQAQAQPKTSLKRFTTPQINTARLQAAQVQARIRLAEAEGLTAERTKPTVPVARDSSPIIRPGKSTLVDADFPFDESQLAAITGLAHQKYGCMTGAAGTGKTTCSKALIDRVMANVTSINIATYGKDPVDSDGKKPENFVPAIALCAFTGRATQMIKKNFPEDWYPNIMTIHKLLGYYPEGYLKMQEDGSMKDSMRFVPFYDETNHLPWDIIVIDEAGMVALDLWDRLWAATPSTTRVIFIGDINQLPPVHGTSIYGYAMTQWPAYELTHIHRQKGVDNPIVDNAWAILQGRAPVQLPNYQLMELPENEKAAHQLIRKVVIAMKDKGLFNPVVDTIITATNGDFGQKGYILGQKPLNESFTQTFNREAQRYIIDAGRERKNFAVGDKVMVTKNDHEIGITNGMTGFITEINENGNYHGDWNYVGKESDVIAYRNNLTVDKVSQHTNQPVDDMASIEAFMLSGDAIDLVHEKQKAERGVASHIVTVKFENDVETQFESLSEVESLCLGYCITCHKSQGGEYPTVIIIMHDAHKAMYYREWMYTAATRASQRVVLLYTKRAMVGALHKQKIKGRTLKEKAEHFIRLNNSVLTRTVTLPAPVEIK